MLHLHADSIFRTSVTQVPDSLVSEVLMQIVSDIAEFDFNGDTVKDDRDAEALKKAIQVVLNAKTCEALLLSLDQVVHLVTNGWIDLLSKFMFFSVQLDTIGLT
jgi:hypothetical protein